MGDGLVPNQNGGQGRLGLGEYEPDAWTADNRRGGDDMEGAWKKGQGGTMNEGME